MIRPTLIVLAKQPRPGRVKTRLSPPCDEHEAAALARAALDDTLAAARAASAYAGVVLALDGEPAGLVPPGVGYVPQGEGTLDRRLGAAFARVGGPAVLIGMDTPQVTPDELDVAAARLGAPDVDSVLGLAADGGFWIVGLVDRLPDPFVGVPMSRSTTGQAQLAALRARGDRTVLLRQHVDVDRIEDARQVADLAPGTRFAATLRTLGLTQSALARGACA